MPLMMKTPMMAAAIIVQTLSSEDGSKSSRWMAASVNGNSTRRIGPWSASGSSTRSKTGSIITATKPWQAPTIAISATETPTFAACGRT